MSAGSGPSGGVRRIEEEDSSVLKFGPDFSKAKALMNSEVAQILEHKREIMQTKGQQPKSDFLKAYQYVNTVKQFRDREVVSQVRRDLEKHTDLDAFEVAQLGNLCPQDAQEARALVPSLDMSGRDIDNAQLTEILEQLNSFKQYPT